MKKLVTLALILLSFAAVAAPDSTSQTTNSIQVISARQLLNKGQTVELFDILAVRVKGFKALLNKMNAQGGQQAIRLFLDGRELNGLPVVIGQQANDEGEFQFTLERNPTNDASWTDLLGSPNATNFFNRPMDVSVGLDRSYAEQSIAKINFLRIDKKWFYGCGIGLLAYFFFLVYLSKRSNMLRGPVADLSALNIEEPANAKTPYSLGKVQMAFWFSIVLMSFLFIWLITNNHDLITPGILGLIGISGGTALGATVIDNSKNEEAIKQVLELQQQQSTVSATLSTLRAINPPAPATAGDILFNENLEKQIANNINRYLKGLQLRSKGFFSDLLTDANSYSFHRLQMFTWTVVLGIVFIYSVYSALTMPDFSSSMLAIEGITAGTYLGFKFPEKQA